jgi:hypothetical protein
MTTIRECLNLYGDALSQEERERLLRVAGDPNLIQEVESRLGALGQEQQAIIDLIGREYDAQAVAAGVPTRDATLEQTIDEAVAEGRMEPGTAVLARHLFSLDPDLDARTNLEISEEVRLATPEVLEAAGIPIEDAEQYQVLGETATSVHDGLLKTAIRLYRGHDADTLVEEFYHRFWDHLDQASRDLYTAYHQQSGDERSVHELFAQEGRDLFFSERLHEQAGPIREIFGKAREALRALISRIRRIRGAQIPDEIRGLYRAAVEPKEITATPSAEAVTATREVMEPERVLSPEHDISLLQDDSIYKQKSYQLVRVPKTVDWQSKRNAPPVERIFAVSVDPKVVSKMEDQPAPQTFSSIAEARAYTIQPWRIADWEQIYANSPRIDKWGKLELKKGPGKLDAIQFALRLAEGCQRIATVVERVANGVLPNETRLEACYGGTCWVNWQVSGGFSWYENMEVRDLSLATEEAIERFLKNKRIRGIIDEIPFIREGCAGDSSHLIATGLAEHYLKTKQAEGITTPTVFISASCAPVTDEQYAALAPYNDLFELHFTTSGWFHPQENMLRLAEFRAAKDAGLPASVRIVTNASDIAGLQMASEGELLDLMRDMGITQEEILETPYHDDRVPPKQRGKPGIPWRSDPTGLFKYICCETKKCGTCPYKCMTKTDRARGEQPKVSYQVRALTQQAIDQFGTTNDPREAAFILEDGRMLDFSGKDEGGQAGDRNFEHHMIGDRVDLPSLAAFEIMDRPPEELAYDPMSWVDAALFGATTGAMRLDYWPSVRRTVEGFDETGRGYALGRANTIHVEVFGRPTARQFHTIRKMITRDSRIYVDVSEPSTGQTRPEGGFEGEGLQARWQLREHLEKFWPGFMKKPGGSVQTHWQLRNLGDGPFDPDAQDPTDMVDDWVNLQDISDPIEIDDTSSYEAIVKEARRRALVAYHQKKKKAERKSEIEFENQAKETVSEIPLYTALNSIAKSKTGKLDLETLLRDYDAETVAELRRKKRGLVAKKGVKGIGYDEAAMDAGYETADEFILDILQSPTQKEAVEMQVQDLLEEYADYMSLEDQDLYMDMLDEEIKILQQLTKKYRPRPTRRIKKTIREQTGLLKVGNLIDEREAMKKMLKRLEQTSRDAFREGRKDAALVAKEQARDLRLRQREQNKRRREANKLIGKMRNMGRRKLPIDFREQLRFWLDAYGLRMKGRKTQEPAESMQAFLDRQEAEGENVDILRAMMSRLRVPRSEPGKPGYRQLTLNELRDLHDASAALVKMGSDREFLISEFKKINFQMTIDEMLHTIKQARPEIAPDLRAPLEILDEDLKWYEGLSEVSKKYFSMLKKAEFMFRALDGHEDFGRVWTETFYRIVKAENEELKLGGELMEKLDQAFAPFVQGWMSGYSWANARHTIRGESTIRNSKGEHYVLTKERMIMIALNSGNEGNLAALMEGYGIDEAFVQDVWSALTAEEKQLVQDIWAAIDSLFPKLSDVFLHLNGSRLQKVEGNYFPLVFDRKLSWKADRQQAEAEMRDFFKTIYAHASPAKGFTYGRVGGKMPPKLDFGVIFKHVRDVVHYSTHAAAVRDVGKIINDARFRGAVYETLGEQTWMQMNPWLQEVARPRLEDISHVDRWAGRLRRNATVVMLGLKMSVAAKQILSFTQTIDELGLAYALRGVYDFYRAPWDTARFIADNSVAQANRKRKWDRELQAMERGMSPVATRKMGAIMRSDDMRNAFFGLIGGVDKLAVYPTWIGAYHKAMDDHGDHHKAVDYADMVVRRTQPAASPKDLAGWQRGGEIQRLSAMFYTFFAVFQNRMMEVHDKVRIGNIHVGQAMLSYWWIMILPAILGEAINKRRKLDPEEMLKALISYRFAGMPIARDFVGAVTTDYDATFSPAFGVLKAADRFGQQVEKAFTGDPDAYKIFRTGTTLAGYVLGLPSRQAVITIDGALDLVTGETTNPMRLLFPEERKKKTVARR